MTTNDIEYLAVLKAAYDYIHQSEDEIDLKEDELYFLVEKTDDDWWRVKLKGEGESQATGLVPAAYVENATPTSTVKALYDYAAAAPGELSIAEDEILYVFDTEEEWLLVQSKSDHGKAGYVPANYVEATSADADVDDAPAAPSHGIVIPDDPPRPVSTYVDPADRVAAAKVSADDIKTWSVADVDQKGKKTKGTLGVGNGSIFFASESSKAAVKKWSTSDITHIGVEKSKHVHLDIAGPDPVALHFSTGSKDTADAIVDKLETSRAMALPGGGSDVIPEHAVDDEETDEPAKRARDTRKPSVHFSHASPTIIPGDAISDDEADDEPEAVEAHALVLYDFKADGPDELTVEEGERVVILEDDDEDWWKCRNANGQIGVIPAQYLEAQGKGAGANDTDKDAAADAERKAQAKAERDAKKDAERKRAEAEKRAKEAQEAAEARRREKQQQQEKAAQRAKQQSPTNRPEHSSPPRGSVDHGRPPPDQVRVWRDRTGQFRVDAAFIGFSNGKLRLHKTNGVVVEVPQEKMSHEDMKYVQRAVSKKSRSDSGKVSDDDLPIGVQYPSANVNAKRLSQPAPKKPTVDWFDFFLAAGCELDDCTRYGTSFDREKIDEAVLVDLSESTLRTLGLREGDIIRVLKAISQRKAKLAGPDDKEQVQKDEEVARQLQAELNGTSKPAPNLFAQGPGGALKAPRRGRPTPSKTLPADVDLSSVTGTPRTSSPSVVSPVQVPPRSSSAASGFDDDAWTNRPSSTKPTPVRAPSAPPASVPEAPAPVAAPVAPTPPVPTASAPPVAPSTTTAAPNLARTTENDIFDQLARLSSLRQNAPSAPPASVSPPQQIQATASAPPAGFNSGMGMGGAAGSIGSHLHAQQTGVLPPAQQSYVGPRGPFAPVPANQGLLQPLVPTQTGFNSFVPTRPSSNPSPFANSASPFANPQQPAGSPFANPTPSFLSTQPTGFQQPMGNFQSPLSSQPTGFQGMQPMATGFPGMQQQPMMSQPTGVFAGMVGGGLMSQQTGMPNQGAFGSFGAAPASPPQSTAPSTNPANIFAQMKSGTFAKDEAPQNSNKYDALRPNSAMQPQMTGWGGGYGNGYGYGQ
ncbi:hypothetical protein CYLTODRAFT_386449 [Cylindrobasidium torrendii FP15055 ss-10]|uniref:Actin cytoskeleton-regulatory complex protein SLA1 n=1 Tax=Cylindrobasidium torrendii FP15055 ss-10 TaxID=1314674 RepID=A0A0D7BUD8_9AGAR|nr:hypothetical protein CYLTODRAFT_386449 [Cylindrobasidium torrendii FP15055 ss-10]